jgi:uncharacterized protein (DUF3820 family)
MRLKVNTIEVVHPDQVIVSVETKDGSEFFVLNKQALASDNSIEIGRPVGRHEGRVLIELPTETDSGTWRVWVDKNDISGGAQEAAE